MNQPMTSPEVVICENREQAAQYVADLFTSAIQTNPGVVLGLATGGTPVDVYRILVQRYRDQQIDFSEATSFNLDEYVGLAADHPESYRFFMQEQLFNHVNFSEGRTHVPNGCASDLDRHASQYEDLIRECGGVDLQLLGIGTNGHIAFNEPGSPMDSRTRRVQLTEETIEANARFFDSIEQVPRSAITMGIGTILESKRIVLMATGAGKADAIAAAINGPIDSTNPASVLQQHEDVVFVLDQPAASHLKF